MRLDDGADSRSEPELPEISQEGVQVRVRFSTSAFAAVQDLAGRRGQEPGEALDAIAMLKWLDDARDGGYRVLLEKDNGYRELMLRDQECRVPPLEKD